jgi:phage terminase large subunit-like protein
MQRSDREDVFRCLEGYRRIRCDAMGSRIQVFASDDRTGDGVIPGGIAILDELHRHRI